MVRRIRLPRYRFGARFYDTLSAEALVYRAGRIAAIELLDLRAGARVLVVGCGTGLDLPHLERRIGPSGQIVGLDASDAMLRRARVKVARAAWTNVTLVLADAADIRSLTAAVFDGAFDAVLFCYSLAIIDGWREAWWGALACLRTGGRIAVVDTDLPTGWAWPLRHLARFALWTGGVDRSRKVWELVARHTGDARPATLSCGHIRVAVGTWSGKDPDRPPGWLSYEHDR